MHLETIATTLGYTSTSACGLDIQRALAAAVREPAEEVRAIELLRLDTLWQKAMAVLERNHVAISHGQVVKVEGESLCDDGPTLAAIDRLLRIQERRAKLLGLDAPTKHEVVTMDAIEAEIQRLNAELRRAAELERVEAAAATGTPTPQD